MSDGYPRWAPNAERARKKTETAERRAKVLALHLNRVSEPEIARIVGVSPSTAHKDIVVIRQEWAREARNSAGTVALRDVHALDADEAMLRQRMLSVSNDHDLFLRYHAQVLKVMERRAKLLGLDAPLQTEITGPNGGPLEVNVAHEHLLKLFSQNSEALEHGFAVLRLLDLQTGALRGEEGEGGMEPEGPRQIDSGSVRADRDEGPGEEPPAP